MIDGIAGPRHLGSDGDAQQARGRLRPGCASSPRRACVAAAHARGLTDQRHADRAPPPDSRGHPAGRQARVDAGRRAGARPRKAPLLLRRPVRASISPCADRTADWVQSWAAEVNGTSSG